MTTETTQVTISETEQAAITRKANATQFVGSHSMTEIIEHIAYQYELLESSREMRSATTRRLNEFIGTVTEFIKDNLDSGASSSDLKELANELDIELTKTIEVEMTVKYYATLTVPMDYDTDSLSESDFDVEISFNSNEDDIEFDTDSTEVKDFEVTESN